jgi:Peptidase_C39 like family
MSLHTRQTAGHHLRKTQPCAVVRIGLNVALLLSALWLTGCKTAPTTDPTGYSHFIGLDSFSHFQVSHNTSGETVMLSPVIISGIEWNELVVSWNTAAPTGTYLKIEARASERGHDTKFYVMGLWSSDDKAFPRASVSHQRDADGDVKVDTLALNRLASAVQIRLTLGGSDGVLPALKFLGLSFCNTTIKPQPLQPNRTAWGKIIPTPEHSQQSYPGGNGWCSPTSLSMVLSRWAKAANRPDWDFDAPEVAAGVFDHEFKLATGNWPFNTAFAGKLDGMRAYVSRFSDISELEDWIAAGIPVIISARWDLLQDGRPDDFNGHLTVCRGFTEDGDLVINDPWTDIKVESVRHVYKRANVGLAWAKSHNTVYLVYPENTQLPADRFGHW